MRGVGGWRERLDRALRRSRITAFPVAVVRKFGDDHGGSLAAVITYHGFLAIFPLTVVLSTILGIVVDGRPDLRRKIVDSALAEFPVVGTEIRRNAGALAANGALRLTIALAVIVWGALGVANALQQAMAQVWNVPETGRPRIVTRSLRSIAMIAVLGLGVSMSIAGSALASAAEGAAGVAVGVVVSLVSAFALSVIAFRVLTPLALTTRDVAPGAAVAAVAFTVLQLLGTYLLTRRLQSLDELYGTFAAVLGLLWWIYLSAQITVLSAEVNAVAARHLWPRSLLAPDKAAEAADRRVLRDLAEEQQRAPGQEIAVEFGTRAPDNGRGDPEGSPRAG